MLNLNVDVVQMRKMVRLNSGSLDDELLMLKNAYLTTLAMAGVQRIPNRDGKPDALAVAGLRSYLRWQLDYADDADRYRNAYERQRDAMAVADEYQMGGIR